MLQHLENSRQPGVALKQDVKVDLKSKLIE